MPHLRSHCTAEQVVLKGQDNGPGVRPDQQRLFQRLHIPAEGSGVGFYAICRIVERADGTGTVRSELGVGATVIGTLLL